MQIPYPYMPEGRNILYVPSDNEFILIAKEYAREHSLDKTMPNCSIIVKEGKVVAKGANGSSYHEKYECERVRLNMATGQGYDLCEGCHPKNHGEQRALKDARDNSIDTAGADLYLWGHWWCCKPCWDTMIAAGIRNVYLAEGSEKMFDKNHKDNIIGRQFVNLA